MTVAEENQVLRAALDAIVNGTMLDKFNHNDDGLLDFSQHRLPTQANLKHWATIATNALNTK